MEANLTTTPYLARTIPPNVAHHPATPGYAFEGGVGGLGKTKPDTGVVFLEGSAPIQNKQGIVTAEILSRKGNPILVEFTAPYPLLPTTNGLEARDLQQSESAFVQVIYGVKPQVSEKELYSILIDQVFGSKGKYGAYGSPSDIKISPVSSSNDVKRHFCKVTFTTLTPGMRESERKLLLRCEWCDNDTLVMLLVGTTRLRFKAKDVEETLTRIANSFLAVEAPRTELLRRSQSKLNQ
ncbi:hypothetical protein MHU86_17068 [Fragilaria crotonensis]|nr:hypothetical protein MHU86_17068 [Fragilaria crotonensis]